MKFIPLNKGAITTVDDADFDWLHKWKWFLKKNKTGNQYVYRTTTANGKEITLKMHRVILGLTDSGVDVDHKDGNGLNNQRSNLRTASRQENAFNRKVQPHSTPFKGVHYRIAQNKFQARICKDGKRRHLGFFDDSVEAARKYDEVAIQLFGTFARTNALMGLI